MKLALTITLFAAASSPVAAARLSNRGAPTTAIQGERILQVEQRAPWYSRETGETYETRWLRATRHRVPVVLGMSPYGALEPEEFAAAAAELEERITSKGGRVRKEFAGEKQNCHAFALAAAGLSTVSPEMWLQVDDQQFGFKGSEAGYLGLLGELFGEYRFLSLTADFRAGNDQAVLGEGDFLLFLQESGFPAHSGIVVRNGDGRLVVRSKFGKFSVFDAELSLVAREFDATKVRVYSTR